MMTLSLTYYPDITNSMTGELFFWFMKQIDPMVNGTLHYCMTEADTFDIGVTPYPGDFKTLVKTYMSLMKNST